MRENFLLGVSNNNKIVSGKIKVTAINRCPKFSFCFDTVKPFNDNSFDIKEYFEKYIEEIDNDTSFFNLNTMFSLILNLRKNIAGNVTLLEVALIVVFIRRKLK